MNVIYADPPYFGVCARYQHEHTAPWGCWDDLATYARLLEHLNATSDAWALSLASPSLQALLPLCPRDVRVAAWVKPFAVFKPNVNPAYAWEPLIFRGARRRGRTFPTTRDWVAVSITLKRGLVGVKPDAFSVWLFNLLGLEPADTFTDLFPGTGAVSRAWSTYCSPPARDL